jgi:hypothetical protein
MERRITDDEIKKEELKELLKQYIQNVNSNKEFTVDLLEANINRLLEELKINIAAEKELLLLLKETDNYKKKYEEGMKQGDVFIEGDTIVELL